MTKQPYITASCDVCGAKDQTIGQLLRCQAEHQKQWGKELNIRIIKAGRTARVVAEVRR